MKKLTTYILPLVALLSVIKTNAQQNSLFNTYSLDPLQLNIAYAGASCTEANVHYRTQWIGLQNAPKLLQLNAHTALGKSNALALRVNSQTQGLLNTLGATLGYSYRIKISETAKVHLGLGIGWTQAAFNAQNANVIQANDVTLNTNSRQAANGFDSEFGFMIIGKKLKAGVSALHLYNSNPNFSGNNAYKTLPQLNTQVSYIFNKDKKVEVEPWLLNRYTLQGDNVIEGMLNFNFVKVITIGAGYRSNYGVLALVGAKIGNLKLAYSFDYGANKNAVNVETSHQVMLGFSMCKNAKTAKTKEEPVVVTPPTPTVLPTVEETKEEPKKEEVVMVKEETKVEPVKVAIEDLNSLAEDVVFDLNKSKLNEDGLKKLDELATLMKKNPTLRLNIIGHTCNKGGKELNELLSVRRATYVRNELIKRGVNSENIDRSKGVGAEQELFDNTSELQSKNRTIRFELAK
jgi:type IX secretion system PorP/SprF family membrane protein